MKLIAHRGNIKGSSVKENTIDHILTALDLKLDVEVDVWCINKIFWLGHDKPKEVMPKWLLDKYKNQLWFHAKDISTLDKLLEFETTCFFHNIDDCTLTSNGYIWTYPNKELVGKRSIAVINNKLDLYSKTDLKKCYAICTDYPKQLKEELND
jgi:hypothetical protein